MAHLRRLYARIVKELRLALSPDLFQELQDLSPAIQEGSLEELAIAHAEILGWLEGLFQATQLAMQLEAVRAFREQVRHAGAPSVPESKPSERETSDYL